MRLTRHLIAPFAGILISLVAHLAQNEWHLYHIEDVSAGIRGLDRTGALLALFAIGVIEGTLLLCFYLPGTAVVILLFVSMRPSWSEGLQLLTALMAGTWAGYSVSLALGHALRRRLPHLVGGVYFEKTRAWIERFGVLGFTAAAFHPNQLAMAFGILGYFQARRVWLYFAVAAVFQVLWWTLYSFAANTLLKQTVVTGSNFQLFLAALFAVWLAWELVPRRQVG